MIEYKVTFVCEGHEDYGPHTYFFLAMDDEVAVKKARYYFRSSHKYQGDIQVQRIEYATREDIDSLNERILNS